MVNVFSNPALRWMGKKRREAGLAFAAVALADIFWGNARPLDLLEPNFSKLSIACWSLMLAGAGIRIWAAGNLRKKEELTRAGIYCMVRHPLYLGTSLIYLSYFLAFGDILLGIGLFSTLMFTVYYPKMLSEEDTLARKFPREFIEYKRIPRLLPNFLLLARALRSDRFSIKRAYENHGLQSLWALLLIPLLFEVIIKFKGQN